MQAERLFVVLSNAPDAATADRIAGQLVGERLAACVNILAPCRSVYRWEGGIRHDDEVPLLIKTPADRLDALLARLKALHPYEVPEIVALPAAAVWPAYLDWAIVQTRSEGGRAAEG